MHGYVQYAARVFREESANAQVEIYLPLLDARAYVSISVYDNCSIDIAFL
jgi:hypothetical protein